FKHRIFINLTYHTFIEIILLIIIFSYKCFLLILCRSPRSTFFPYTTLFRSICHPITGYLATRRCVLGSAVRGWVDPPAVLISSRSEEHTSELQSRENLVFRLLLEKKNKIYIHNIIFTNY